MVSKRYENRSSLAVNGGCLRINRDTKTSNTMSCDLMSLKRRENEFTTRTTNSYRTYLGESL